RLCIDGCHQRYGEPEYAAVSLFAFDANLTAVAPHNLLSNRQPQTDPPGRGARHTKVFVKDAPVKLAGNALSGAGYFTPHPTVQRSRIHRHLSTGRRITEGVSNEIGKDHGAPLTVDTYLFIAERQSSPELYLPRLGQRPMRL